MPENERSPAPVCSHAKALWAPFWRMCLLTPITILGILAFAAVLGLSILPPFLAVILVISADYVKAVLTLGAWIVWLRLGGGVRRFVLEGFEHGSL